ncbi:GNAT family N-acetyltransferase [Georgenia sunbinii]|uniref:GNAT family N-acetyltransferase n=1 Tax=Georgenia sunbinii TaxID=3117728 RepID=UPI002F2674C5
MLEETVTPTAGDGLSWRPLLPADNDALVELLAAIEAHDDPPYRTTAEESAETFDPVSGGIGSAMTIGVDADGVPRAYGIVRVRAGGPQDRAQCDGGVHPAWRSRGIGTALLEWEVRAARQIVAAAGHDAAEAVIHVEEGLDDVHDMLVRAGFHQTRWYTEMRRDLAVPIPDVVPHGRVTVEPWTPELDDAVRRAHNDAFADARAGEQHTTETWSQGRTFFAPTWSFVALDRSSDRARVAGYLISGRYEGDWEAQGWTEGYTEILGVRREWRGMRVATGLLATAMRAYAADGMGYAGLGVEMASPHADLGLFGHLGYEPTRGSAVYTLTL